MAESVKAPLALTPLYGESVALVESFQTNTDALAAWTTGDKIDK